MAPLRPLGHIAGNLNVLAVMLSDTLRRRETNVTHCCWVDDDGCVYVATIRNPRARAVVAHAPEQIVNRYRKPLGLPLPLTVFDIFNDLKEAAIAFGRRQMTLANAHAALA